MQPTMKRLITFSFCVVVCVLMLRTTSVIASPIVGSNDNYEFLMGGADLSKFSIGAYVREQNLKVRPSPSAGMVDYSMKMKKIMGYVGYDILRWGTIYGIMGTTDTRLDSGTNIPYRHESYNGSESEYGLGFVVNLIDHDIADPTLIEDRIRVTAGVEYTKSSMYWNLAHEQVDWDEIYASARVSLINQLHGYKEMWPLAIGLYAGPIYATIISSSLNGSRDVGFIGGMEIYYSDRITFDIGVENLDDMGYNIGFTLKF